MADIIRRVRLHTIDDVKLELAKIYRESRNGKLPTADLGRFANVLHILSRIIEGGELEKRLETLEQITKK